MPKTVHDLARLAAERASLDHDTLLSSIARQILRGPGDTGRSSYQIAMTVCEGCGAGRFGAEPTGKASGR